MADSNYITCLELDWKDWSKRPKTKRVDFPTMFATRMLKGWSFLGTSLEQHNKDIERLRQVAINWMKENGKT